MLASAEEPGQWAITKHIHAMATATHGITDKKELQLYSAHSLRVGACVQLHVAGKSADFIKKALRWKSDTFQMYLRNVGALAQQRNDAINAWDPDGSGTDATAAACAAAA